MRSIFANSVKDIAEKDIKTVFLTGDIGFNALEEVRFALKDRFINMGVAEQGMISVAAGIATRGYQVFCYSIAPFITYRCLEQIRNDACFHDLPVYIVGNGGGYGYGIMGSSHHALEDIAILSGLPNMHCYVPSFDEDVDLCLNDIILNRKPAYLRLGLAKPNKFPKKSTEFFTRLTSAENPKVTIACSGPVIHNVFSAISENNLAQFIEVFNISKIPYGNFTNDFLNSLTRTKKLIVVEEHISVGGIGQQLACDLLSGGIHVDVFKTLYAKGYPSGRFGNQQYHMQQSGIDKDSISKTISELL